MSIMQLTGSSSQKQIVPKDHGMHIWMPPSLLGIALETPTLPRVSAAHQGQYHCGDPFLGDLQEICNSKLSKLIVLLGQ